MRIATTRFGELEVPETHCLKFPHGIPGFPEEKVFAFLPYEQDTPFAFLQSVSDPHLTFVIVRPFLFFADYDVALQADQVGEIGVTPENLGDIWNIVTIRNGGAEMTVNLIAPVVINWQGGQAMQVVLDKTAYTTRHPLIAPSQTATTQAAATQTAATQETPPVTPTPTEPEGQDKSPQTEIDKEA